MPGVVHYEVIQRVAMLTIDNPPVNALGDDVWEAIDAAVARAGSDAEVDAIVLKGAGSTFVAGADIHMFRKLTTPELAMERSHGMHAMLRRLEDSAKPLVAAIHGHALGGGLELALACHYRVATADASVGQPEVLLGIIPGAGGTQRLPRLCGADLALRMCTDGKPLAAPKAREAGILDAIAGSDLAQDARAFALARAAARETRRTRDIPIPPPASAAGIDSCRAMRQTIDDVPGNAAARAAVDAVEAAFTLPFDDGSIRERELFAARVVSVESKALRHLFFAEREAARIPGGLPPETPVIDVRRAAVVGAGTMGGGIAMAYAAAGIPVLLKDVDEPAIERGMAAIRRNYESGVARGRLTPDAAARLLALITPTTSYGGFETVDVVVEAVFEHMDLKKRTFAELASVTRPECVLASNTSTLDIDEFARASGRPGTGRRASLLQSGERDEARRGRPGEADVAVGAGDIRASGQAAWEGPCRRRQLLRIRGQPDAVLLPSRSAPAARGRGQRRADRRRDDCVRDAGRSLRDAGHCRHRRGRADPTVRRQSWQAARGRTAVGNSGSAVRDGPVRPEDLGGMVSLRAGQPARHHRSAHSRPRPAGGSEARHHAPSRSTTTKCWHGSRRRWPTRG